MQVRTVADPEKWPILPEMTKSEEQQETTISTGESHVEKTVNSEPTTAPTKQESTKPSTKSDTTKSEPSKTKPTKSTKKESTKPEGLFS